MRTLKLCTILGLLAALVVPAGAIQYNADGAGYTGPVKWKISNWDMGVVYTGDASGGALVPDQLYDTALTLDGLTQTPAPGAIGTEDSWGVFKVTNIYKDDGSATEIWSDGDQDRELVGIFYGGIDNALTNASNGSQIIQSSGLMFDVYEQSSGLLTTALLQLGSGGRDGINMDQYPGIGYSWVDAGGLNGVVDPGELTLNGAATLVITGNTTAGVGQIPFSTGPAHERATFTPSSLITGSGEKTFYVDITGGQWQFGPPFQYEASDPYFVSSPVGDMFVISTAATNPPSGTGAPFGDWTILSEDPIRANAKLVPEPLTMLALASGLVGLGGYLRRRTRI